MQFLYPDRHRLDELVVGPWNSGLAIAVGYISQMDRALHYHHAMRETCVITAGLADVMVEGTVRRVETGAVAIIEAGEVHAWRGASPDFRAILIHEPWVDGDTVAVAEV